MRKAIFMFFLLFFNIMNYYFYYYVVCAVDTGLHFIDQCVNRAVGTVSDYITGNPANECWILKEFGFFWLINVNACKIQQACGLFLLK